MAIDVYDAGNGDGLFNILGKAFYALKTLNTARLTTVPTEVQDVVTQMKNRTGANFDMERSWGGILSATESWRTSGDILAASIQTACQEYLKSVVALETGNLETNLITALTYLIETAMGKDGANFRLTDANTVGCTVTPNGSNHSDMEVFYALARGDGYTNENILGETITAKVTSDSIPSSPVLTFTAPAAPTSNLDEAFPKGSGSSTSLTAVDPAGSSNLVPNGDFMDATLDTTWPDNWILVTGTRTTKIALSAIEVQTVAIAGTPTAGHYYLTYRDELNNEYTTTPLPYNATSAQVQSALNVLPGLSDVTVSQSGSTPNYTHTISLKGVGGNVTQLVAINKLDTGTVTPATTTSGETETYRGRALVFIGDASVLHDVWVPLSTSLKDGTVYFCCYRVRRDANASAGTFNHSIITSPSGTPTVTTDEKGTSNSGSYAASSISTSGWDTKYFSFRVKKTVSPMPCYLRFNFSVALANTGRFALNHVCVFPATQLYPGGPYAGAVIGRKYAQIGDSWTLAFTNNRASELQEWMDRVYDLRGKDLLLPTAGAGTSIPDSVIA